MKYTKTKVAVSVSCGAALLFIALSFGAHFSNYFTFDVTLSSWIQSKNSDILTSVLLFISFLFTGWMAAILVILSATIMALIRTKIEASLILAAGLLNIFNVPIKWIIGRPRPSGSMVQILISETGYSFPSGHALFSTLFLGTLAYIILISFPDKKLRIIWSGICVLLALAVGYSRIYLGVHWVSDVMGGYLLGILLLSILIALHQFYLEHSERE